MVTQGTSFTIESVHVGDPIPQIVCACALFDTLSTEENSVSSLLTYRYFSSVAERSFSFLDRVQMFA